MTNKITKHIKCSIAYITVFFIALVIHLFPIILFKTNHGTPFYSEQFDMINILLSSLAAPTMLFLLIRFDQLTNICEENNVNKKMTTSAKWQILFSLSYSLCSYTIIQYKSYSANLVFVLLPILFYATLLLFQHEKTLLFLITAILCFSLDPTTTTIILISVFFICLIFVHTKKKILTTFIHYFFVSIFSLLISAVFSFPQIAEYHLFNSTPDYKGFICNLPTLPFLSRFLPGAVNTASISDARNINLYFGLFILIWVFFYFFNKNISIKERIGMFFLTIFFLLLCQVSPVQYLFEGFSCSNSTNIEYDFIVVFFLILLAYKGFCFHNSISSLLKICAISLWGLFIFLSLFISKDGFHSIAITTIIIFSIIYAFLVVFQTNMKNSFYTLSLFLLILELSCNSIIISFQDYLPSSDIPTEPTDESTISDTYTAEQYSEFCNTHIESDLYMAISGLQRNIEQSENITIDPFLYQNYAEFANDMCAKNELSPLYIPTDKVSISFNSDNNYSVTKKGYDIFYISDPNESGIQRDIITKYTCETNLNDFCIVFDIYNTIYNFNSEIGNEEGFLSLPLTESYGINFKATAYTINSATKEQVLKLYEDFKLTEGKKLIPMNVYYIAVFCSCIGIFMTLCFLFNNRKNVLISFFNKAKNSISSTILKILHAKFLCNIYHYIVMNRIYFLSFFIPFAILLCNSICFDIRPFGKNSIWDGDGLLSTLPVITDIIRQIRNGNFFMSLNSGYGYSFFPIQPFMLILSLIPESAIATVLQYVTFFAISFSSFGMVFYLTHRFTKKSADPMDCKLLIPGIIYALNSFILFMIGYYSWFYIIAILPFLIFAFEKMIYKKKWCLYVILLSIIMMIDLPLAFFTCILLIILFFSTLHFSSVVDFIKKGFQFGLLSILAVGNSFLFIGNMYLAKSNSGYAGDDKIRPVFRFFGSFFNQWKQHMIFSNVSVVNEDDSSIILYASLLAILSVFLYITNTKIKIKDKIRHLIPIALLYFSFNEQISSYILNGFHYQSNVPNRHVFILIFLLMVLLYESITNLEGITYLSLTLSSVGSLGFIICSQFFSEGNEQVSFITSIVLLCIYILIFFTSKLTRKRDFFSSKFIAFSLTLVVLLEISANTYYVFNNHIASASISSVKNTDLMSDYYKESLGETDKTFRTCFATSQVINSGMFYNIPSVDFFASCTSQKLLNFHKLAGGISGTNYTYMTYGGSKVTNTLFGIRYIFVPQFATTTINNLEEYEYVDTFNNYYIFENPDALIPFYYAPYSIADVKPNTYTPMQINDIVACYLPDEDDIFTLSYLANKNAKGIEIPATNNYEYISSDGKTLTTNEALEYLSNAKDSTLVIRSYYMNTDIKLDKAGDTYIYTTEYVPLGYLDANKEYQFTIDGPRTVENQYHLCCTINEQTYNKFLSYMKDKQLKNILYSSNSISGDTDYTEAGYTMISMPYNSCWSAYIDGKRVDITAPTDSYMLVETPAGNHHLELKYECVKQYLPLIIITAISWCITLMSYIISKKLETKNIEHPNNTNNA